VSDRFALRTSPAALVLMGGGARAAYQVGVLKAIATLLRDARRTVDPKLARAHNPFPILLGTSSGAINAAALASHADDFYEAVARLASVWENFSSSQVFRSDAFGVIRTGARWMTWLSLGWTVRRSMRSRPKSLFDNSPLRALLTDLIELPRIARALEHGHLRALAVNASSYASGRSVTFYQALNDFRIPEKLQRTTIRTPITIAHLLASSAIPFIFPPVALGVSRPSESEYFGDGSMRQIAPISPALSMGAERVLVIGAGQLGRPGLLGDVDPAVHPSLAQIAGHALASIFLDSLASDIEQLDKMNRIAAQLTAAQRRVLGLREVQSLVIAPSRRIDGIAAEFLGALPRPVRALFEVVGANTPGGAALASYLLFERPFTCALIDLGVADTMARRDEVLAFLTYSGEVPPPGAPNVVVF